MDKVKILLGEKKHKLGVNVENHVGLSLVNERKVMPPTDYTASIDAYERYFTEKDASEKYRLSFTVNPICSNVLFNVITEPVYKEGSDDCRVCLKDGISRGYNTGTAFTEVRQYHSYKRVDNSNGSLSRYAAVHDTAYSHPEIMDMDYHCGYDIFDNHYLRRKEGFFIVNSAKTQPTTFTLDGKENSTFNTLYDTLRNRTGETIKDTVFIMKTGRTKSLDVEESPMHIYYYDGVDSYYNAITENLIERDGWFGFLNKVSMPVKNYKDKIINKCINNKPAYGQIDMYPGRDLYSFVPKYNSYRRRNENNWDFCITYPYSSTTKDESGDDIPYIKGGLLCSKDFEAAPDAEHASVFFRTAIKHGFSAGEFVIMSFLDNSGTLHETKNPVLIRSVGEDGHTFSVRTDSIFNEIFQSTGTKSFAKRPVQEVRVSRYSNGMKCQYYIRVFKKIELDFDCPITKMAFAQNAYTDQVAQILFNGDIITSGLTDNIGRPLSEIFLTIVKANHGWKEWYEDKSFNSDKVEFSHCFGKISAGIDLPTDKFCSDYNVHRIHNIEISLAQCRGITPSPKAIDSDVTISGCSLGDGLFYGDIVEFSPGDVSERVLEPIYYRFNTAQREFAEEEECIPDSEPEYGNFYYTEFIADDYDFNDFEITNEEISKNNPPHINLIPEGYYYNPHYGIKIHEFSDTVSQGYDRRIAVTNERKISNTKYQFATATNYYAEVGDTIYSYVKSNGTVTKGPVGTVTETGDTSITVEFDGTYERGKSVIYRENTEKPEGAYELHDGTGRYLWREVLSSPEISPDSELYDSVFTNGAHYFHKNITFYLRRQDPDIRYGIGAEPNDIAEMFIIDNRSKDISSSEYVEEGVKSQC